MPESNLRRVVTVGTTRNHLSGRFPLSNTHTIRGLWWERKKNGSESARLGGPSTAAAEVTLIETDNRRGGTTKAIPTMLSPHNLFPSFSWLHAAAATAAIAAALPISLLSRTRNRSQDLNKNALASEKVGMKANGIYSGVHGLVSGRGGRRRCRRLRP